MQKSVELGLSLKDAHVSINEYRSENNLCLVRFACVYGLHCRLKPKVRRVKKRKTGSRDVGSEWAMARYNWVRQLIVMFGQFVGPCPYFSIINTLRTESPLAPYFEPSLLPKANLHNTTFWDEHHKKCVIGFVGSNSDVVTL